MSAATAQIGGEAVAHLLLARLRNAVEQLLGAHDHAIDAIAALRRLLLDEGALQRMGFLGGAEAFDRGDVDFADRADRGHARAHRTPADEDRAGAALGKPAAELGAVEPEIV